MSSNSTKVGIFAFAMLCLLSQTRAACPETEYACANGPSGDDMCAWDGSSSTYTESFVGSKHHDNARDTGTNALRRKILSVGCPNHAYVPVNPNCAGVQDYTIRIPAYPYFNGASYTDALAAATDLSAEGGDVGIVLNGGVVYTAYAGSYDYNGDGVVDDADVMSISSNAVTAEGDTFDACGGHASGSSAGFQYHYHVPPTCLIAQIGQAENKHSPQIGWFYDGFPMYGPYGPDGVQMKKCGQVGADATYCLDKCNGYYGALADVDTYLYRYYITGETSDQQTVPTSPLPTYSPEDSSFFPFTPLCALGCGMNGAGWDANWLPDCQTTAVKGYSFTDNLDDSALKAGVTTKYTSGSSSIPSPKKVCDALSLSGFDSSACVASVAGTSCQVECASGSYGDAATYTCTSDKGVGTWSGTAPTCTTGERPFVTPNILIIQPDDLYQGYSDGWQAPSDPGFDLPKAAHIWTTNIDKIGTEGAVFTRAYTASGMCSPSRMALLTGRYASRGAYAIAQLSSTKKTAKVTVPNSKMHGNDLTHNLPRALKLAGYTTAHVGKWHLSSEEALLEQGCTVSSSEYECAYEAQRETVKAAGFDTVEGLYVSNMNTCGTTCTDTFGHNMEWQTAKALEFMSSAIDASTPFFLYFNPTPPHGGDAENLLQDTSSSSGLGPYYCDDTPEGAGSESSQAWAASCKSDLSASPDFSAWCSSCSFESRAQIWYATAAGSLNDNERGYIAGIYWVDQSVGVLYDYLAEKKVLDDTIVIVLSDNGEAKGTLYEYGIRTLMNVRWPNGGVESGTQINEIVSNLDIVPTLFSLARFSSTYNTIQYDTDGVDISSLLNGTATSLSRNQLYMEMARDFAVVESATKLIFQDQDTTNNLASSSVSNKYSLWGTEFQLYDISSDECETENLADNGLFVDALTTMTGLKDAHATYVTNNGCCSVDLTITNICETPTVSNADASDCTGTEAGASCTVTCASGYDGDDATYTCGSDGSWSGSITCTFMDYSSYFQEHVAYKVVGYSVKLDFTTSDGTSMNAANYLMSYCGDCDSDALVDIAAELCLNSDDCQGFSYFSTADDPKITFKSVDIGSASTASQNIFHYDQTDTLTTTVAGEADAGRRRLAAKTFNGQTLEEAAMKDYMSSILTDALSGEGTATVEELCYYAERASCSAAFDDAFTLDATQYPNQVAVKFSVSPIPDSACTSTDDSEDTECTSGVSRDDLASLLVSQSDEECSPLKAYGIKMGSLERRASHCGAKRSSAKKASLKKQKSRRLTAKKCPVSQKKTVAKSSESLSKMSDACDSSFTKTFDTSCKGSCAKNPKAKRSKPKKGKKPPTSKGDKSPTTKSSRKSPPTTKPVKVLGDKADVIKSDCNAVAVALPILTVLAQLV